VISVEGVMARQEVPRVVSPTDAALRAREGRRERGREGGGRGVSVSPTLMPSSPTRRSSSTDSGYAMGYSTHTTTCTRQVNFDANRRPLGPVITCGEGAR